MFGHLRGLLIPFLPQGALLRIDCTEKLTGQSLPFLTPCLSWLSWASHFRPDGNCVTRVPQIFPSGIAASSALCRKTLQLARFFSMHHVCDRITEVLGGGGSLEVYKRSRWDVADTHFLSPSLISRWKSREHASRMARGMADRKTLEINRNPSTSCSVFVVSAFRVFLEYLFIPSAQEIVHEHTDIRVFKQMQMWAKKASMVVK